MSAPYGLDTTSFLLNREIANAFGTGMGYHSVQALTALAALKSISGELKVRGYDVTPPGLAKNAAIASFSCNLRLMKVEIFLTANEPQGDLVECKLNPLGWRRAWKSPAYEEIWQEWERLRLIIDEHLTKTFKTEWLRWVRPSVYKRA